MDAYGTISVGTSATEILAANPRRTKLEIQHVGTNPVYLGLDSSVTTGNGRELVADGTPFTDETTSGRECYKGSIQGIVAASTEDVRYMEFE